MWADAGHAPGGQLASDVRTQRASRLRAATSSLSLLLSRGTEGSGHSETTSRQRHAKIGRDSIDNKQNDKPAPARNRMPSQSRARIAASPMLILGRRHLLPLLLSSSAHHLPPSLPSSAPFAHMLQPQSNEERRINTYGENGPQTGAGGAGRVGSEQVLAL